MQRNSSRTQDLSVQRAIGANLRAAVIPHWINTRAASASELCHTFSS